MKWQAKQRGVGLLELLLSLAVTSVLLLAVTHYFSSANFAQNANSIHMQFIEISQALYRYKNINNTWKDANLGNLRPWLYNSVFANSIDSNGKTAPGPFRGTTYQIVYKLNDVTQQETVLIQLSGFSGDPNDLNNECNRLANRMNDTICVGGKTLQYCYPSFACQ
jgi:Tfp pilus assembly protein PilV